MSSFFRWAASCGHLGLIKLLYTYGVKAGIFLDIYQALQAATCHNHFETAKWIYSLDPSVNLNQSFNSLLDLAHDDSPLKDWLISLGATPPVQWTSSWTEEDESWYQEICKKADTQSDGF